jgi:hypothetical protein
MNAISKQASEENPNLAIWQRNEATDPSATQPFNRPGGFRGTAINATYIVKRLTAEFGPIGLGWGVDVTADDLLTGAPVRSDKGELLGNEIVHRIRIRFWWTNPETKARCEFDQVGQTTFVGRNKNGWFTDEEFGKKSLSDALTKAASFLGFGADIRLGLWEDNKYVEERAKEEQANGNGHHNGAPRSVQNANGQAQRPATGNGASHNSNGQPKVTARAIGDGIPALDPDPLRDKVYACVQHHAIAKSLDRVAQLKPHTDKLLAEIDQAKRPDLRKIVEGSVKAATERFTAPEPDPFATMPE